MSPGGPVSSLSRKIKIPGALFVGVFLVGTLGYRLILGREYSLLDYVYMTVITVSTVGYGEVVDVSASPAGRIFTMVLILLGMSVIVYSMSNITAYLVEGDLKDIFWRNRMKKRIDGMSGHYIVCGAGTLGRHIIEELSATGRRTVVIDQDRDTVSALLESYPAIGTVVGDATESEVLDEAGIGRARGVLVAATSDKDNLVITITARQLRPDVRIVARCADIRHKERIERAGAETVVSSNLIGALRMASAMMRPSVVSFLDRMLRDTGHNIRIEEARVGEGSRLEGLTVAEARKLALILAVEPPEGGIVYNPKDAFELKGGTTVIIMGTPEDRERMESAAAG